LPAKAPAEGARSGDLPAERRGADHEQHFAIARREDVGVHDRLQALAAFGRELELDRPPAAGHLDDHVRPSRAIPAGPGGQRRDLDAEGVLAGVLELPAVALRTNRHVRLCELELRHEVDDRCLVLALDVGTRRAAPRLAEQLAALTRHL